MAVLNQCTIRNELNDLGANWQRWVGNPFTSGSKLAKVVGRRTCNEAKSPVTLIYSHLLLNFFFSGDGLLNDIWLLEGTAAEADKNPSAGGCGSSDFNLVALHGIFMFIGWGVLLQAGAFIARYFRHKDPWWFKMHRGLQVNYKKQKKSCQTRFGECLRKRECS